MSTAVSTPDPMLRRRLRRFVRDEPDAMLDFPRRYIKDVDTSQSARLLCVSLLLEACGFHTAPPTRTRIAGFHRPSLRHASVHVTARGALLFWRGRSLSSLPYTFSNKNHLASLVLNLDSIGREREQKKTRRREYVRRSIVRVGQSRLRLTSYTDEENSREFDERILRGGAEDEISKKEEKGEIDKENSSRIEEEG